MDRNQIERAANLEPGNSKTDAHVDVSRSLGASEHPDADLGTTEPLDPARPDQQTDPARPADADIDTQHQIGVGRDQPVDTILDVANSQTGAMGAGNLGTAAKPFDQD